MTLANVTDVVVLNIDSDVAVERVCPFCGQMNSFKWDGNGELIWLRFIGVFFDSIF